MRHQQTTDKYHWASKTIHWLTALTVVALFALGLWMVGLDYYHSWYQTGPDIHRSVGLLLAALTILRISLYFIPHPQALPTHSDFERVAASLTKVLLLVLLICLFFSGYFISTATGDPVYVFDWFAIPSIFQMENLEDIAGEIHEYAAWALIVLAGIHALAAIKHHFIDKDDTLKRMSFGELQMMTPNPSKKELDK